VARLRGQVRFESIDALVTQMNADVATCLHLLGVPAKQP
jgi:FAD synthase